MDKISHKIKDFFRWKRKGREIFQKTQDLLLSFEFQYFIRQFFTIKSSEFNIDEWLKRERSQNGLNFPNLRVT